MADAALAAAPGGADLEDIQGLVYGAYSNHGYAGYVLARLDGGPERSRAWLRALAPDITPAAKHLRPHDGRTHVALSPLGIVALGQPLLAGLPQEAKDGMASRARVLRDDPPETWELGGGPSGDDRLDALVIVYARDAAARDAAVARRAADLAAAGARVYPAQLSASLSGREPFGFADGLAQPFVPGHHGTPRDGQQTIAAGEIVLGYPNAYGKLPASPMLPDGFDLGRNGSYLVWRKLRQDVTRLWQWCDASARAIGKPTEWLAAKVMGRWPSGASLAQTWLQDDPAYADKAKLEAFAYQAADGDGARCPIASHVRRANPRDARGGSASDSLSVVARHRIVRRGRPFGPPVGDHLVDDGATRGLYFICLQASIARGFEFIQQTWLGNHGFHGLYQEVDPVMGNGDNTGAVTIPAAPFRYRLTDVPDVVHVMGGGYFLLPSRAAIAKLSA